MAAILIFRCTEGAGVGDYSSRGLTLFPRLDSVRLKIKMDAINGKTRSISTISGKNRGLWTVYSHQHQESVLFKWKLMTNGFYLPPIMHNYFTYQGRSLLPSFNKTQSIHVECKFYVVIFQILCCSFFISEKKARASSICKRFLFPESNEPPKVAPWKAANSESNRGRYYRNSTVSPICKGILTQSFIARNWVIRNLWRIQFAIQEEQLYAECKAFMSESSEAYLLKLEKNLS